MGSIRKSPRTAARRKGEIKWEARYRDPTGKQRTKTCDSQADARAFLAITDVSVMRGEYVAPEGGKVVYRDWVAEWQTTVVNLRPSTLARDEQYIDRYVLPQFGDDRLASIDQMDVRSWVADLLGRGLAPATVVKAHQLFAKSMTAAVDVGLLGRSPCGRGYLPKIERPEVRFLTPAEVGHLAGAIDPRYRAWVLVGAYGGLRFGELAGLRRGRVDLMRGTVDVAEIVVEVRGHHTWGPPKTRAGRRTVPLPRFVIDELTKVSARKEPGDLMFTAPDGGPLRASLFRRRFFDPAVTAVGLDGLTPHGLRHTAVALWIEAGASPLEVASRAGHTSVVTVLDRYGHLLPKTEDVVTARLDEMGGSVATTGLVARRTIGRYTC